MNRLLYLGIIGLILTACTSTPTQTWPVIPYETRMAELATISHWRIKGRFNLTMPKARESASFYWHYQNPDHYTLHFIAPLGLKSAKLTQSPAGARLMVPDKPVREASTAQVLLARHFGVAWPIDYLRYWIRGMPAPNLGAEVTENKYNHLTQIIQDGWTIQYKAYRHYQGMAVPASMTIEGKDIHLTLHFSNWAPGQLSS